MVVTNPPSAPSHSVQNVAHQLVASFYTLPEKDILSQGDILSIEKLKEYLPSAHENDPCEKVYPYFFSNYSHGIILNADCDIYRKDGRSPKVKCIQIAAVVEGSDHIQRLLKKVSKNEHYLTKLIDEDTFRNVTNKFESLINNQEKLYFYLPESWDRGFKTAHLVRLDTSVSIQIDTAEKYSAILKSRTNATIQEPYKSKLGENFSALFDRTGLTDAQDHLNSDYESWLMQEMQKYFIPIQGWIYRRAIKDVKVLANKYGADSEEYQKELPELLRRHSMQQKHSFEELPAYQSIKKILENRVGPAKAPDVIKAIFDDADVKSAFSELLLLDSAPAEDTIEPVQN